MEIRTIEELKALISLMEDSSLTELKIKNKDGEITLSANKQVLEEPITALVSAPKMAVSQTMEAAKIVTEDTSNFVLSPLVGTFYASSSPESPPYVQVGTKVNKGDVVCIIEAMKVMNEIQAETDGVIDEILVTNTQLVDFNMKLFKLKP